MVTRERRTIPVTPVGGPPDCPLAPPAHADIRVRALHRVCVVLGGVQPLAEHLKVAASDVASWLRGEQAVPESIFLAAVEILLLHTGPAGGPN